VENVVRDLARPALEELADLLGRVYVRCPKCDTLMEVNLTMPPYEEEAQS
jgi:hypothetical protein